MRLDIFLATAAPMLASLTEACGHHSAAPLPDPSSLSTLVKRSTCRHKTAIHNVRIFNGQTILPPSTVVIDGHIIGNDPSDATLHVDGEGGVLLPGFIDSHVHPNSIEDLKNLTRHGVTTAFQMACFAPEHCPSFQGHDGLVDMYHASAPATAPGSMHGTMILNRTGNAALLVKGEDDVARWIEEQLRWDPNFFKLIAQSPGLSQDTMNGLVQEAHNHGKKVACHAADLNSHRQASLSFADQIHHLPLDFSVDESLAREVSSHGQVLMPTLSVMKAFSELGPSPPNISYAVAQKSLRAYHSAGVPILASTDANRDIAAAIAFGESFHSELELMVEAGMGTLEALRAATVLPAMHWGLDDRGVIEPGKRADLVLISNDPIEDIRATRNIKKVWVAGAEFEG